MSGVVQYLFPLLPRGRSGLEIVNWWESRRAAYNLAVGGAGVVSLGALALSAALPPHPAHLVIAWPLIPAYALLANVAYCAGPLVELAFRRWWGDDVLPVGPGLFRHGLSFAVGLTLLPAAAAWLSWGIRVLHAVMSAGGVR